MIQDTQSAQISQQQDEHNIYAIMKTMCPPSYHHNGFVATHALGHMMYGYTLLVPMNQIGKIIEKTFFDVTFDILSFTRLSLHYTFGKFTIKYGSFYRFYM